MLPGRLACVMPVTLAAARQGIPESAAAPGCRGLLIRAVLRSGPPVRGHAGHAAVWSGWQSGQARPSSWRKRGLYWAAGLSWRMVRSEPVRQMRQTVYWQQGVRLLGVGVAVVVAVAVVRSLIS